MTNQAPLAVLFPGQGAQFVGMTSDLIESAPGTEEMFTTASRVLGRDLWQLCREGPEDVLHSTAISQPAIFVTSLAVLRALDGAPGARSPVGATAAATAGLSLGEYSALVFAGALRFADALEVVVRRGAFMQEACDRVPGGMTSILGLDLPTVREVVAAAASAGVIGVANVNAPRQIVVSGETAALERAAEIAKERGARRAIPLKVAGAYHSPLMASASRNLAPFLERLPVAAPRVPFFPNVSAERTADTETIRRGLLRQIEAPVLWSQTLEALREMGIRRVLEPGPGRVIAGLMKQVAPDVEVHSVLDAETRAGFLATQGA